MWVRGETSQSFEIGFSTLSLNRTKTQETTASDSVLVGPFVQKKQERKEERLTSLGMSFEVMTCGIQLQFELVLRYKELCVCV